MNSLYLALELGAAAFFLIAGWLAFRRGRLPFLELVSAATFGLLLEEGDQLIFETYHYSSDFILSVDRAPVVIGLTWAVIIAGAMRITDAIGVRRRYAPVVDSVLAIMLDLAFDAVAIRMGLWTWRGIASDVGWFGVPAGNFYAWLFVTLAFSLVTRAIRDRAVGRPALEWAQLLVPLPAFAILLFSLVPFSILQPIVDPGAGRGLGLFAISLAAFVAVAAWATWGPDRAMPNGAGAAILDLRLTFVTRLGIHLFFLGALLFTGIAAREPALFVVALALLATEAPLSALVHRRMRGRDGSADAARTRPDVAGGETAAVP